MESRIKLRRTQVAIDSVQSLDKLKEGEPLFSFQDHSLVIGNGNKVPPDINYRFFAHPKIAKNLIYAGPNIGSDDYPTFRSLVTADITSLIAAGGGISKSDSGARITISNNGIRNISPGSAPGTLEVNKNGQATIVSIPGLGTAAYHDVEDFSSDAIKYALSDVRGGDALKAKQLSTSSSIRVNLASTSSASFNGTQSSLNPGVTGILPAANGGTGSSAGLTKINNTAQSSQNTIYAPTTAGTANQILVSSGGTAAPTWKATASGAAYATSTNGPLTFGVLPSAYGGTGVNTSPSLLVNLGSTAAANVFQASPRPGTTGTLPVTKISADGANKVLMTNENNVVTWKNISTDVNDNSQLLVTSSAVKTAINDAISNIDLSQMSGLYDTYIWDIYSVSNATWTTELGEYNKYTPGESGSSTRRIFCLNRGSIATNLFKLDIMNQTVTSRTSVGRYILTISFKDSNNVFYVPREISGYSASSSSFSRDPRSGGRFIVDTVNLDNNYSPVVTYSYFNSEHEPESWVSVGSWDQTYSSFSIELEDDYSSKFVITSN